MTTGQTAVTRPPALEIKKKKKTQILLCNNSILYITTLYELNYAELYTGTSFYMKRKQNKIFDRLYNILFLIDKI